MIDLSGEEKTMLLSNFDSRSTNRRNRTHLGTVQNPMYIPIYCMYIIGLDIWNICWFSLIIAYTLAMTPWSLMKTKCSLGSVHSDLQCSKNGRQDSHSV